MAGPASPCNVQARAPDPSRAGLEWLTMVPRVGYGGDKPEVAFGVAHDPPLTRPVRVNGHQGLPYCGHGSLRQMMSVRKVSVRRSTDHREKLAFFTSPSICVTWPPGEWIPGNLHDDSARHVPGHRVPDDRAGGESEHNELWIRELKHSVPRLRHVCARHP